MNQQYRQRHPAGNPLANVLVVLVGAVVIAVSFVIGVVALIALVATLAVAAAIVGVRFWWLGRKVNRGRKSETKQSRRSSADATVIEGEYRVVRHDRDLDRDA